MSLASMMIKNGPTFSFATAQFDDGTVPDVNEVILEELTDPGVSGRRWRQIYQQYRPLTLRTSADCSTYDVGKQLLASYQNALGTMARSLNVSLSGTSYVFSMLKITGVMPKLARGNMVGDGATGTGVAVLYCQWSLVLTGFAS